MSWKYKCVRQFAADIESIQNNQAQRDAFMAGFMKGSVMYPKVQAMTFNVDRAERDSYEIEDECDVIVTTEPMLDHCGADVNLLPEQEYERPIYFTPFMMSVAMDACKSKCSKDTLAEYINKREYKAGVAFGRLFDRVFFLGMPEVGERGITQQPGTKLYDMSMNAKFNGLNTADPNAIANFFTYITHGMSNPRICMGSSAYELIGLRVLSTTGDTCSDVWDCAIERLNNRMGRDSRSIFEFNPIWDHITGIDPAATADEKTVLWVYDADYIKMGLQDDEEVSCVITKGHDIAESKRSMHMSTPHITRMNASRWVYNFVDQAEVVATEGERYQRCGQIGLTVPTPIVQ